MSADAHDPSRDPTPHPGAGSDTLPGSELDFWTARYAQPPQDDQSGLARAYLIARVGGERFAVPMADLDEVACVTTGVALPQGARTLLGLANVRGELLPLLDTAALLGVSAGLRLDGGNRTLVVRDVHGRRTGLPVETIESVVHLDPEDFQAQDEPAPTPVRRIAVGEHAGSGLSLIDVGPLREARFSHF